MPPMGAMPMPNVSRFYRVGQCPPGCLGNKNWLKILVWYDCLSFHGSMGPWYVLCLFRWRIYDQGFTLSALWGKLAHLCGFQLRVTGHNRCHPMPFELKHREMSISFGKTIPTFPREMMPRMFQIWFQYICHHNRLQNNLSLWGNACQTWTCQDPELVARSETLNLPWFW